MSERHLPVRPDLTQLKHQAKDLLREMKRGRPNAKLAEAQFALARSYGVASWPRLVLACRMVDAIWRDDVRMVREIVTKHPALLHEPARGVKGCNWGPPMSYAANLGRNEIIAMLHDLGANDVMHALARAMLQGEIETAQVLQRFGAHAPREAIVWCAEALNSRGMAYAFEFAGEIGENQRLEAAAMTLETYSRSPEGKHHCLELLAEHGVALPNTPPMALHRGRIDLLEEHLGRDPELLTRGFAHAEIYPASLKCHADEGLAVQGTPLAGSTLLHLCVDYGEIEIARWLLDRGMPVDARAAVDAHGFGGHTALFGCVVTAPGTYHDASCARLLLERGADPNAHASLRKDGREYRDVTPITWGERFYQRDVVNEPAMRVIAERGGRP